MKPLKKFSDFVASGVVSRASPDKNRSDSLIKEAEESYIFLQSILKKIGLTDDNANNIIKNVYDIIMALVRAQMFLRGYNSSGMGAHEAEVAYLRELGFSDGDIEFANQLRYFRNGILYYGKKFDKEYAKKVLKFLETVRNKLE